MLDKLNRTGFGSRAARIRRARRILLTSCPASSDGLNWRIGGNDQVHIRSISGPFRPISVQSAVCKYSPALVLITNPDVLSCGFLGTFCSLSRPQSTMRRKPWQNRIVWNETYLVKGPRELKGDTPLSRGSPRSASVDRQTLPPESNPWNPATPASPEIAHRSQKNLHLYNSGGRTEFTLRTALSNSDASRTYRGRSVENS